MGIVNVNTSQKMADGKELVELLEGRIPEARKQLRDSHKNLADLAAYCEHNYVESGQGGAQLEETKRYAAQSLASVAYQVNVLAVGVLELLDKQMKQMGEMEASIHHISQVLCLIYVRTTFHILCSLGSSYVYIVCTFSKAYRPLAVGVVLTSRFDIRHLGAQLQTNCAVYIVNTVSFALI